MRGMSGKFREICRAVWYVCAVQYLIVVEYGVLCDAAYW